MKAYPLLWLARYWINIGCNTRNRFVFAGTNYFMTTVPLTFHHILRHNHKTAAMGCQNFLTDLPHFFKNGIILHHFLHLQKVHPAYIR